MPDNVIISASRRTDLPAFYSEWLIARLMAGACEYVHPYGGEKHPVPMSPERVAAVVFWTKNFAPMLSRLDEMERLGFRRWLVHYTVTGLGREWEPKVPDRAESVETIKRISGRIGPERVMWRFDPMVFTDSITVEKTISRFASLCRRLEGLVTRAFVSVMQPYAKTAGRTAEYEDRRADRVRTLEPEAAPDLCLALASVARSSGITVHSCCTPVLEGFGVQPARCIDGNLVLKLWPECGLAPEPAPTRKGCGCHRAIDIGAYDTCPHQCLYCYANVSPGVIEKRFASHRPDGPSLV